MNRLLAVAVVLLLSFLPHDAAAEDPDPGHALENPKGGAPWHHEKTGLLFPQTLHEIPMQGGWGYKDPAWGTQLRYVDNRLGARADVYVYTCERPAKTAKERAKAAQDELSEVVGGLKEMENKGRYRKVKWDNGTAEEFTLGDDTKTTYISVPAHYELVDDNGQASTSTPVLSQAGVMTYRGHYVKLRYTLPADAGKEALEQRDAFAKQMLRCVLDASLREGMLAKIAEYRKDPLSVAGREAASTVVTFSDKSPLVNVVIGEGLVDFAKGCRPQGAEMERDVMRAFIVGAADAALREGGPAAVVAAGVTEVRTFCARAKEKNGEFESPELDKFEAAVRKDNRRLLGPGK